jgi:predicted RNA-binding Zn ribbon-like protein
MRKGQGKKAFIFLGNQTSLDFINTLIARNGQPVDLIETFSDFVTWLVQARLIDAEEAKKAERQWVNQAEGRRTLDHARDFRATLHEMVERIAAGKTVPQAAIEAINGWLRHRVGYPQLTRRSGKFERTFQSGSQEANQLLGLLAESASDLLTHCDRALIKKCQNRECVLFFYDTTKNHARHWCSMSICGNRMKVAKHYRLKRRTKGR